MDPQEMNAFDMDLELGLAYEERIERSPRGFLAHIGYELLLLVTYILAIAKSYGAFTTGLPPRQTYEYVSAAAYELFGRFRIWNTILWQSTKICKDITLFRAAEFLHKHVCCFFAVFFLCIYFVVDIIRYHQDSKLSSVPITVP